MCHTTSTNHKSPMTPSTDRRDPSRGFEASFFLSRSPRLHHARIHSLVVVVVVVVIVRRDRDRAMDRAESPQPTRRGSHDGGSPKQSAQTEAGGTSPLRGKLDGEAGRVTRASLSSLNALSTDGTMYLSLIHI